MYEDEVVNAAAIGENWRTLAEETAALHASHRINDTPFSLIAVTKNHGVEAMRAVIDAGAVNIGENRVQEAKNKFAVLERQATRHLIGHLQTNKVKAAVKYFDLIHSVDSEHLARALNDAAFALGKRQQILVQVNIAKEESKSGVYIEDLPGLLATVRSCDNLLLKGFMMIAPFYEDNERCRPLFAAMNKIFKETATKGDFGDDLQYLSMGMSHDYKVAIEEGANMVRIGTAIFGARDYNLQ